MGKEWNQIPKAQRERVLRNLDALAGLREDDHADAYRAAAELLRKAALPLYASDDLAVVYAMSHRCLVVDWRLDKTWFGGVCLIACRQDGETVFMAIDSVVAETTAARDLLDALRGGGE